MKVIADESKLVKPMDMQYRKLYRCLKSPDAGCVGQIFIRVYYGSTEKKFAQINDAEKTWIYDSYSQPSFVFEELSAGSKVTLIQE